MLHFHSLFGAPIFSVFFRDGETTIKIKYALLKGGHIGDGEENRAVFRGKRHDSKILISKNVNPREILLSLRRLLIWAEMTPSF